MCATPILGRSEAIFHFEQAVLLNPNEIGFLKNLAYVYEVLGRVGEATQLFETILKRWPHDDEALKKLRKLN